MSSKSDISTKENMTFRIGIHLLISQDGRVSTIFRQSLEDILDGIDQRGRTVSFKLYKTLVQNNIRGVGTEFCQ